MTAATPLDAAVVEDLARGFAAVVAGHYRDRPRSRDTILEVLNALAVPTAIVLAGTDNDPAARAFFDQALADQLADLGCRPARSPAEARA